MRSNNIQFDKISQFDKFRHNDGIDLIFIIQFGLWCQCGHNLRTYQQALPHFTFVNWFEFQQR
jgi:hypothetical protein